MSSPFLQSPLQPVLRPPLSAAMNDAGGLPYKIITAAMSPYQASCGDRLDIDSSAGNVTVTMPLSPAEGCSVYFRNTFATLAAHPLTIARNGQTIAGQAQDLTVSTDGIALRLFNESSNWRINIMTLEDLLALKSGTGTQTNVTSVATDQVILASNSGRKGGLVFNDSAATLYLLLASGTAAPANCSVSVAPGGYFEIPFHYVGVIKGIWSAVSGAARVTEFTA